MSVVSRCPKCGQYVTLPPEVSPNATVRCPCCDAEFPLGEAAPAMPPALVPVEAADEEGPDLVVDAPMPALNGTEAAGLTVESENAAPADSDEPGTFDIQISEADRKKKRRPGPTAVYPDAIDIPAVGQNDMHSAAAIAARLRQNARRDNLSGELVKVVLGGVLGLAVAYYALNYFGGPRFDKLPIYLPGCPHTYHHWSDAEEQR